jgi:DNA-binding PadR family transcriptional regulator
MKPESHLPLKPDVFQILLTLLEGESHGYVIMQDIAERTGGEVRMLPGALYRHLQRMLETGMIRELDRRKVADSSDERRRYYAITAFGRRVAEAEATRLAQLVRYARSKDLVNDARLG